MNRITDPISERLSIVIEDEADKRICKRALGPASISYEKKLAIDRIPAFSLIEADVTEAITRSLAEIALGKYGTGGFGGLTQDQADLKISELSGDVEDYFEQYLS